MVCPLALEHAAWTFPNVECSSHECRKDKARCEQGGCCVMNGPRILYESICMRRDLKPIDNSRATKPKARCKPRKGGGHSVCLYDSPRNSIAKRAVDPNWRQRRFKSRL